MMAGNVRGSKSIGEQDWKPHNINVTSNKSTQFSTQKEPGPDWSSSLRCYNNNNNKNHNNSTVEDVTLHHSYSDVKVSSPDIKQGYPATINELSVNNWSYYSAGSNFGKRCVIDGEYISNQQTSDHIHLEKVIGTRAKVFDCRGNLPVRSPGDKSYYVPEYSKDFHKEGSTLPAVDFSRAHDPVPDTFIPLNPLPKQPSQTFKQKEAARLITKEKADVKKLDDWSPAATLQPKLLI